MNFSTFFSKQARKPNGLFGRLILSRIFEKGNSELNRLIFDTLATSDHDHVLEIGFGTGTLINQIADQMTHGVVEGVDFSETMVAMAKKKNLTHLNSGKVKIHSGDFDTFPFEDNCFDKIFTVNTIYFWKDPQKTLLKIWRLLKPGGQLLIGLHEKSEMEKMPLNREIFNYYSLPELRELLLVHGAFDIDIISKNGKLTMCHCAVATKQ